MKGQYFKEHSTFLDRDMEYKLYGTSGKLCFVFPCQDGRFFEWEDRQMFEQVDDLILAGKIRFCTVDSIDAQTWSSDASVEERISLHERWVQYVLFELRTSVYQKINYPKGMKSICIGASLGGYHAANFFFRYPQFFDGVLAISGIYDMSMYYAGFQNALTKQNNPCAYLQEMEREQVCLLNQSKMIFTVGQGAYEEVCKEQLYELSKILQIKGIHAWIDPWGFDVNHDWPWWKKMIRYYLPKMI